MNTCNTRSNPEERIYDVDTFAHTPENNARPYNTKVDRFSQLHPGKGINMGRLTGYDSLCPTTGIREPVKAGHIFPGDSGGSMSSTKKQSNDEKNIVIPPTGISENGRSICIVSHLHGIPEEDIRIDLEKTQLIISAVIRTGKVLQKVTIPEGSRISKKKFRDGILEIILERPL